MSTEICRFEGKSSGIVSFGTIIWLRAVNLALLPIAAPCPSFKLSLRKDVPLAIALHGPAATVN